MDNSVKEGLPKHLPVDMAIAPDQKPYEHTHVIHTQRSEEHKNKLAQHSLSPEKLGVVGYVKDVAGFVKDVVEDRRQKKAIAARRSSAGSVTDKPHQSEEEERVKERPRSSVELEPAVKQAAPPSPTRLADAITGLFPGVGNNDATATGCTHADELRNQMMHINEEGARSYNNNKLV